MSDSPTPGPWKIGERNEARFGTRTILGADGTKVCSVESFPLVTVGKADAALIAAAPSLLTFVRLIAGMTREGEKVDGVRFEPTSEDCLATLNELITQARKLQKQAHP
jgi:hypothetical protein